MFSKVALRYMMYTCVNVINSRHEPIISNNKWKKILHKRKKRGINEQIVQLTGQNLWAILHLLLLLHFCLFYVRN